MSKQKQLIASIATAVVKIIVLILIVKYVIGASAQAYEFGHRVFTEPAMTGKPGITYEVSIDGDTDPKVLGEALEADGLIRDAKLFYVQYLASDYRGNLQAGTYDLSTSMTAEEMLQIMCRMTEPTEEEEG